MVGQYKKLFDLEGIQLSFTDEAIDLIASKHWNLTLVPEGYALSAKLL
ncbi:MAG: hypothetical protein R2795_03555 [Saprospiraceae bacterium]